jgi:hypothetical protein
MAGRSSARMLSAGRGDGAGDAVAHLPGCVRASAVTDASADGSARDRAPRVTAAPPATSATLLPLAA